MMMERRSGLRNVVRHGWMRLTQILSPPCCEGLSATNGRCQAEMSPDYYRKIALTFPGAAENSHMNHPDFRVGGKIFATLWKGGWSCTSREGAASGADWVKTEGFHARERRVGTEGLHYGAPGKRGREVCPRCSGARVEQQGRQSPPKRR